MRVLAAVLGALMATAGCISGGASTAPAMSELDTAREAAKNWVDDPQLVGLYGIEPPHRIVDHGTEVVIHADPDPGDGNAPGWGYLFTGEGGVVGILMIAGLGVLAEAYTDDAGEMDVGEPITSWELDSTRVAAILAEHEDWPARAEDHTVFWGLAMEDGRPVWHVAIEDVDGADTIYGDVDATDGSVLRIERNDGGFIEPEFGEAPAGEAYGGGCAASTGGGQVTPLSSIETAPLSMDGPGALAVEFGYNGAGLITLSVELDGEVLHEEDVPPTAGGAYAFALSGVPPGDYVVRASTSTVAVADGEILVRAAWGASMDACFADGEGESEGEREGGSGLAEVLSSLV